MRIGYLFLCHQDPEMMAKIVRKVTENTDNIAVIHVDAKVNDFESFRKSLEGYSRAVFSTKRFPVFWGGMNVAHATLTCMEIALKEGCDRVVVFEGMTWPLHSNEYINDFFESHPDTEFIRAINATRSKDKMHYMRSHGWYPANVKVKSWDNPKSLLWHVLSVPRKLGIKYRRGYYVDRKTRKRYDCYWGWAFVSLTRKCAEYVVRTYRENEEMMNYFSHVFIPGECYIASMVFNSHFAENTMDGHALPDGSDVRGITYFEYGKEVRVFTSEEEMKSINREKYLYVRKVSL